MTMPEAARVGEHPARRLDAERRVVVLGVVVRGPTSTASWPRLARCADQVGLELEAGVIGTEVDAHGTRSCPIAGVDGVPGGWVLVRVEPRRGDLVGAARRRRGARGDRGTASRSASTSRSGCRPAPAAGPATRAARRAGQGPLLGVPGAAARGAGRAEPRRGLRGGAPAHRSRDQPADVPHRAEDPRVGRAAGPPGGRGRGAPRAGLPRGSRPGSAFASEEDRARRGTADRRAAGWVSPALALADLPAGARLDDALDALAASWSARALGPRRGRGARPRTRRPGPADAGSRLTWERRATGSAPAPAEQAPQQVAERVVAAPGPARGAAAEHAAQDRAEQAAAARRRRRRTRRRRNHRRAPSRGPPPVRPWRRTASSTARPSRSGPGSAAAWRSGPAADAAECAELALDLVPLRRRTRG